MYLNKVFTVTMLILAINISGALAQTSITLKKGQIVSLITSKQLSGTNAQKNEYFQKIFPIATSLGFKLQTSFNLQNVQAEGYEPFPLMNLFTWPNQAAQTSFEENPDWPAVKATRKDIWEELRICRVPIPEDIDVVLNPDKLYHISFLWVNEDNPKDLDKYLKATESTRESFGAREVLAVTGDTFYHSFLDKSGAPNRVRIVEWPDATSHQNYMGSKIYRKNQKYLESGVSKVHVFEGSAQ